MNWQFWKRHKDAGVADGGTAPPIPRANTSEEDKRQAEIAKERRDKLKEIDPKYKLPTSGTPPGDESEPVEPEKRRTTDDPPDTP